MTGPGSLADGRRFSLDEVGDYIELATRLQDLSQSQEGLSYDELREVAGEVGVSEEALEAAVQQADAERQAAGQTTDVPDWRSVGYRILEILCLAPPRNYR